MEFSEPAVAPIYRPNIITYHNLKGSELHVSCVMKAKMWFLTGLKQTGLYTHRTCLEAGNFGFRK